jgi:putative DNA primase/helicase
MIAVSEVNVGQNIALLKRATGRDPIPTRSHHQDTFEMVPTWTLWIIANERPRVPDTDTGVWRRMREVPFVTRFEHPDPTIRETLSNPAIAGPAILAWAIEGCLAWQREGLGNVPDAIRKATADYQSEMNPVSEWLEEKTQLGDTEWTAYAALRDSYVHWAKANGISKPLGLKQFSQRMTAIFAEHRKGNARGYDGISLLME